MMPIIQKRTKENSLTTFNPHEGVDYEKMLCPGGCGKPPHWCQCDGGHRDLSPNVTSRETEK